MSAFIGTFASIYHNTAYSLRYNPCDITCNNKVLSYEIINYSCVMDMHFGISIYSHEQSRAIPITFILAEFLWIMNECDELAYIEKFNKAMSLYSDNGKTLYGAYGPRIFSQYALALNKLILDKHSRQAYITIYKPEDVHVVTKDLPCNTALQFLIRNNRLHLIVTSRSSDFITGFSIDAVHWEMLLIYTYNKLLTHYSDLRPGKIFYNIASLHIYESDKSIFDKWNAENYYSYTLAYPILPVMFKFGIPIVKNLEDLIKTYEFNGEQTNVIYALQNIFKNRKYKIRR